MIHELLVALAGLPSDIFVPSPPPPAKPKTLRVRRDFSHLHPAERDALDSLAAAGHDARVMRRIIDDLHGDREVYARAFANGLQQVLDGWLQVLDDLEAQVLACFASTPSAGITTNVAPIAGLVAQDCAPRMPLAYLKATLSPHAAVLCAIRMLLADSYAHDQTLGANRRWFGCKILDLVLPRALDGRPDVADAARKVAGECLRVFVKHVAGLMVNADAGDQVCEFFVQRGAL